jgi:pyruvate/2-oxoglutarate dehydrogenase complex dihydrolipoamide acyltransferase (E2) component
MTFARGLMRTDREQYTIARIPKMRRFAMDAGILGRKRHNVHGLIEVDVTEARKRIKNHRKKTEEKLSFTAFLINCLSEAIQQNPHLLAYRNWRGQLVIFDEININTMIEIDRDGKKNPIPHVFKATNRKTYLDLHNEIRATQKNPSETIESKFMEGFLFLPGFIRRMF